MNRAVGVIPARWASTRFPGKMLAEIGGRPLIHWVIDQVQKAEALDEILVATDDERIRDSVTPLSVHCVMTKPDHPSGTDRIAEAVAGIEATVVVNIQGDEPLIDPALVSAVAETLKQDSSWDMATASCALEASEVNDTAIVKVVTAADGRALYFSRSAIPHIREQEDTDRAAILLQRHIGIYGYRKTFLETLVQTPVCDLEQVERLEQLRALYIGARMKVIPWSEGGIGIDLPEHVARAEAALRAAGRC